MVFVTIASVNAQSGFGASDASGGADVPASSDVPSGEAANPQAVDTQALAALILILENPTLRKHLLQFMKQQVPPQAQPGSSNGAPGGAASAGPGQSVAGPSDTPESAMQPAEDSVVKIAMDAVGEGFDRLLQFLDDAVALERLSKWVHIQSSSEELSNYWLDFLIGSAVILAGAITVYWLVIGLLRRLPALKPRPDGTSRWLRGKFLARQLVILLAAVAGYWAAAYVLFITVTVPARTESVLLDILATISIGLALCSLVRVFLCPHHPSMRLMQMRDEVALDLFRWLRRIILWITFGRAIFENIGDLQVPASLFAGVERLWGLAALIISIILVLRYRSDITNWIVAEDGRFVLVRRFLSRMWLPAYFAYAIGSYIIWALNIKGASILVAQGTLGTIIVMFLVQPVALALERWLDKAENSNFGIESVVILQRLHRYADFAGCFAKAAVYAVAAVAIAAVWQLDPAGLIETYLPGSVLGTIGELLLILVICVAIWEAFDLTLAVYMEATDDETGTRIERSARTRTLVPLVRTIVVGFLLIAFAAAALNSLGLDIAPLLATAGIVGIAIGFGAQKLVQDVITGLFMLFQDTISVGDIVELGGIAGTVQRLTIRTIELRDIEGNLHTIPFSSVSTVKNMTREFAFAMIDVGISYRENADHVMELLKHLGAELENHPAHGPNILAAIEVMGVQDLADSAVIIRCRFMVKPLTQFGVRRAFLGLIKRRFDEMGIEIPFPQRTLTWAPPHEQPSFETGPLAAAATEGKDT
jgi:small conductance mechanosensitive channel